MVIEYEVGIDALIFFFLGNQSPGEKKSQKWSGETISRHLSKSSADRRPYGTFVLQSLKTEYVSELLWWWVFYFILFILLSLLIFIKKTERNINFFHQILLLSFSLSLL